MCKDIPRKAKPQLQLKLPRDMKCSMRSFYCQTNSKGTNKEKKVLLLLTRADDLLKRVILHHQGVSEGLEPRSKVQETKELPAVEEN